VQNGKSFRRAWMPLTGTVASDSSRGKVSQTMWTFRIKKTKGEEKIANFGNSNGIHPSFNLQLLHNSWTNSGTPSVDVGNGLEEILWKRLLNE
jgi:hypothetical protein